MSVECDFCYRWFNSHSALHAHCVAKWDHPYCEDCERLFRTDKALEQHMDYASVHQDNSDNYESSEEKENEDDYCYSCERQFVDAFALQQHLSTSGRHNWCFACAKDFSSPNALSQHNSSRVHKAADMKCPMCPRLFKTPSGIAEHVEQGGCNPRINRHQVTAAIHAMNIVPTISINRRITGPAVQSRTTYIATPAAWNGYAYECYLCHRNYRGLDDLNKHLASAAHDAKEFQCPHGSCRKKFTIISALIKHIESESCGLAKFKVVERITDSLTSQFTRALTL
ncbi:hypothetical protein CYLTODRAFT_437797 [Cylindrobasidium torrendii FP15055 ss-10]|uniref:C2H2-type domain-containing protein n=1 Tax=Cylindrobasidium torrendii FP15055 ss-10 TaxID=1314674 RepID=A0A0D7B5Y2_9AGAR|nr:hypothetical protein CYLTODRAFT_437797 [Cylindrobasidium torrendii FP15055 ss-10]